MNDIISRQDAIEVLKEYEVVESDNFTRTDPISMMTVATIANCIEAIVELPSAEPDRKWIPVTEALPKDMDRLLATIVRSNGEKRVRSGDYYKGYFMMDNGDTWKETDKGVLAWMPLVEPWRGE